MYCSYFIVELLYRDSLNSRFPEPWGRRAAGTIAVRFRCIHDKATNPPLLFLFSFLFLVLLNQKTIALIDSETTVTSCYRRDTALFKEMFNAQKNDKVTHRLTSRHFQEGSHDGSLL